MKRQKDKYSSLIGLSMSNYIKWLEFQFDDKMSWDNYGTYWHIDHVMPCSLFDLTIEEEILKCFNWKNLRPLNGIDNIKKGNKIDMKAIVYQEERVQVFTTLYLGNLQPSS
jgi:hypothetical protein